jgi:catechol 2,3-dioxygenase-like lactoylglutathione lyase family enzyme
MPVDRFEHLNIRSADVDATRAFYERVLGLRVGERPPFASRGYWLYLGDRPVVHIVQRQPGDPAKDGSGNLDHVAFHAVDLDATRAALVAGGIPFQEKIVPHDGTVQLFVHDPDGLRIELNFAR